MGMPAWKMIDCGKRCGQHRNGWGASCFNLSGWRFESDWQIWEYNPIY